MTTADIRNAMMVCTAALTVAATSALQSASALAAPPPGVTPARFAPSGPSEKRFFDYVYSGVSFDVLETTSLASTAGCRELRLLVPGSEFGDADADRATKSGMALLKTQGDNVFECSGGPLAAQLRFVVHSEPGELSVLPVDLAATSYSAKWSERSKSTRDRLAAASRDGNGKRLEAGAVLTREVAHVLLKGFADHDAALEATRTSARNSEAKLYGTVTRASSPGGYYGGQFYGRPTLYQSPWITNDDLDTGQDCSPATKTFLQNTQGLTGLTTGDDCGHMLAYRLGGSGWFNNSNTIVFTQDATVNRGSFATHEGKVYKIISDDGCGVTSTAWVELQFHYDNSSQTRVSDEHYTTRCGAFNATCKSRMAAYMGTPAQAYTQTTFFDNP